MEYAYARVSSQDQNLERQLSEFAKAGIKKKNIFKDKQSGKDFERTNYQNLINILKQDDLLVIKSIDRLGRNYTAIIEQWHLITNKIGANILVLDMPLLDTRAKSNSLVGKFISDIVLQVLSFVAQNERENIRTRQAEGILEAKKRGVKFGRPQTVNKDKFLKVAIKYKNKQIKLSDALKKLNMKRDIFYYYLKKFYNTEPNKMNVEI